MGPKKRKAAKQPQALSSDQEDAPKTTTTAAAAASTRKTRSQGKLIKREVPQLLPVKGVKKMPAVKPKPRLTKRIGKFRGLNEVSTEEVAVASADAEELSSSSTPSTESLEPPVETMEIKDVECEELSEAQEVQEQPEAINSDDIESEVILGCIEEDFYVQQEEIIAEEDSNTVTKIEDTQEYQDKIEANKTDEMEHIQIRNDEIQEEMIENSENLDVMEVETCKDIIMGSSEESIPGDKEESIPQDDKVIVETVSSEDSSTMTSNSEEITTSEESVNDDNKREEIVETVDGDAAEQQDLKHETVASEEDSNFTSELSDNEAQIASAKNDDEVKNVEEVNEETEIQVTTVEDAVENSDVSETTDILKTASDVSSEDSEVKSSSVSSNTDDSESKLEEKSSEEEVITSDVKDDNVIDSEVKDDEVEGMGDGKGEISLETISKSIEEMEDDKEVEVVSKEMVELKIETEDKPKVILPSRKSKRISLKRDKLKAASTDVKAKEVAKEDEQDEVKVEMKTEEEKPAEEAEVKTEIKEEVLTETDTSEKSDEPKVDPPKIAIKKKLKKEQETKQTDNNNVKKKRVVKVSPKQTAASRQSKKNEELANEAIRRSSRIKTISSQKKSARGKGLVKKESNNTDNSDNSNSGNAEYEKSSRDSPALVAPTKSIVDSKPVKVKSRWRRTSELEMNTSRSSSSLGESSVVNAQSGNKKMEVDEEVERRLKQFVHLKENQYLTERISCKEAKKMTCDCFLTQDEIQQGEFGCGEDCLNRLLMIECGNLCTVNDRCTNKRFQKGQSAPCEVFRTEKKGLGIRAAANIPYGEFILEYVGEVLDPEEFEDRAADYSKDKNRHYYFMSLRADAVIDATQKGNISRFINHSCDPNAETQKWTVGGELRIGFFSTRTILAGEEVTFDYQFQRYGKEAQKCFCEATNCRGWLGEEPDDDEEEEEDEEDEEEEEGVVEKVIELDSEKVKEIVSEEVAPENIKEEEKAEEKTLEVTEIPVQKEKSPKKEKKAKVKKITRKDIFEDLALDDEIASLQTTGLKNQAHTLKLSRLMVRAKESNQRAKLLAILKAGDMPCRRLFLDYHGLRLMHGWMTDAQQLASEDNDMEYMRLETLQTLSTLPIPNKTMLQDSKVLSLVEKWSVSEKPAESSEDSESNSPQLEQEPVPEVVPEKREEPVENDDEEEIRRSVGMDFVNRPTYKEFDFKNIADELINIFDDAAEASPIAFEEKEAGNKPNIIADILALASKLLETWANLKEVFRIPKKERIEQMKEHERQADKRYKAMAFEQVENQEKRGRENRYSRSNYRPSNRFGDCDRNRKNERIPSTGNSVCSTGHNSYPRISKHERRKLFAMQVEQQAEEERRRKQRESWRQHEKHCMMMGTDPRFTAPYDPNRGYQCIWNPQIGQWQNYALSSDQHVLFNQMPNSNFPFVPRPQNMSVPPPQKMHSIPPPQVHGMPHVMPNIHSLPPTAINHPMPSGIPAALVPPIVAPPTMAEASMGSMPPMPNIPPMPTLPYHDKVEDPSQVTFMGPIPPPAKLPAKWKCAKDKYGRPYYYHVKIRKSQWEPPELPPEEVEYYSESTSSSDTSSLSSDSSSEDTDSDDIDDEQLMLEIRSKFSRMEAQKKLLKSRGGDPDDLEHGLAEAHDSIMPDDLDESSLQDDDRTEDKSSLDRRIEELGILRDTPPVKKRRIGLVQEIIISPRTEEDSKQFKENIKKYKQNKEKLRKQKEMIMQQSKKVMATLPPSTSSTTSLSTPPSTPSSASSGVKPKKKLAVKTKLKEMDNNNEASRKIKEIFRSNMAGVMVGILNAYRKLDCKQGRITNTDDFKHLARKLTHFVMLKELKHCQKIEDLTCTESVKAKAKEFVRKYMSKFGEQYIRPPDDLDNYG
ncbi:PREDICTED: probable histone-lysine N-methyltransferase CG1716 [Nicrophorus vespilloides]|uniref:[histone H3]-lysine(36) N-trimethyltransferase n=1 Tax=Nicrophorus vespilloides TaxID=110193 RepID=A0ABM1NGT8_NICVS|nr:PREDICTED: probable histone-lysine N-methyltransferase CG1716 [Nicrophorus vespilloides]